LKLKHISLQEYPNHKDISHIGSVVCDSALLDDEGNPRVREEVIKKGQVFESLDAVKFFFQDYDVRHHRPFYSLYPISIFNLLFPFLKVC
jgi:hypothetical protein